VLVDGDFGSQGIMLRGSSSGVYSIVTGSSAVNTVETTLTDDDTHLPTSGAVYAAISGAGGMVYPGVGIALSTGSAWGTSITNNSANWNTAYGWGDHDGLYDPTGTAAGLVSTHESTYSHTNYNTAYSHSQVTSGNPHSVEWLELDGVRSGITLSGFNDDLSYNDYSHPNHSGQVTSVGDGAQVATVSIITAQTALASGLASTDELMVSDAGVLKRMDISVIQTYMQNNLTFSSATGTVTSVAAGNGMNFTTITTAGSVTLGTPSTLTSSTTNAVTSTSHTHAVTGLPSYGLSTQIPYTNTTTDGFLYSANLTFNGSRLDVIGDLEVDTINEHSGAAGVTVEGVLIKDGDITLQTSGVGKLKFGDGDTYFEEGNDDEVRLYCAGAQVMAIEIGTILYNNSDVKPNSSKSQDIGSSVNWWDNVYVDRLYIDAVGQYIDVSGTDLAFTSSFSGTVTLASLVGGATAQWTKSGTNLSPTTSGDDILLASSTERIVWGDGDTYIYENTDDFLTFIVGNTSTISFSPWYLNTFVPIVPDGNKTIDLGEASYYWDNVYVDRLYVDNSSTYIDVSGSNMTFTDGTTGTKTLAELAGGGGTDNITIGDGTDQDMWVKFNGSSVNADYIFGWDESASYFKLYQDDNFGSTDANSIFAWNPANHSFILGIEAYSRDAKLVVYENGGESAYMRNVSSSGNVLTLVGASTSSSYWSLYCESGGADTFVVRGDGSVLIPELASDDTEDHVVAIDDSTGLLTKRSVFSLVTGVRVAYNESSSVTREPSYCQFIRARTYTTAQYTSNTLYVDLDTIEVGTGVGQNWVVYIRLIAATLHSFSDTTVAIRDSSHATIATTGTNSSVGTVEYGVTIMWDETESEWTVLSKTLN